MYLKKKLTQPEFFLIWRNRKKIKFGADLILAISGKLRQLRQIFSAPKFVRIR